MVTGSGRWAFVRRRVFWKRVSVVAVLAFAIWAGLWGIAHRPQLFWGRFVIGLVGAVSAGVMLRIVVLNAKHFRLQAINGEIALVYESIRRIARTVLIMMSLSMLSAFAPSWRRDRVLIWLYQVFALWVIWRTYRTRREAERFAAAAQLKGPRDGA